MKLLLCAASLDPATGGPAQSVPQLAGALADLGHQVALWSPSPAPAANPNPNPNPSPNLPRLSGPFADALAACGRPDLVHDNGLWRPCHHQVARACARRAIPRVVSPRGMLEPWALQQRRWKKRIAWLLYQRRDLLSARFLHATSTAERDQLRHLGLNQPALILPNGVERRAPARLAGCDRPPAAGEGPQPSHTEVNGPAVRPCTIPRTALFLSRLHPKKGLELLVEAWARVRPPGWRMRVVGPDEAGYRQRIMAAVTRAGLSDQWALEDMAAGPAKWSCLAEAELFILPSFSENFGIVVAEALVAGLPVITTTATPWAGLREHRCGWWTEPSVDGITTALREATALSPEALHAMGRRGAAWAGTEFHWPAIARTMADAYQWAVHAGPKPPPLD